MALYKNRYRIESVRLQNWDYSNPGLYYITVCVKERLEILGQIINSKMVLNENGEILKTWLLKIDKRYENVKLDTWVIMPNHWHCVIDITGNDDKHDGGTIPVDTMPVDTMPVDAAVETIHESSLRRRRRRDNRRKMLLSKIIGYIKMNSSKYINLELNQSGTGLWQKGYYDRIIRDKDEYYRVVNYIENNPCNWEEDRMNK